MDGAMLFVGCIYGFALIILNLALFAAAVWGVITIIVSGAAFWPVFWPLVWALFFLTQFVFSLMFAAID